MASSRNGLIAAERRRRIYNLAMERGSINVTELSRELGVNRHTVRRDLDELDKEGKLIRSYGGAIAEDMAVRHQPYSMLRNENLQQKAWIGQAALKYLPDNGLIWIGAGSTTYQLVVNMPEMWPGQVITGSLEIALHLVSAKRISVGFVGGKLRMDSFASDGAWAGQVYDIARWNTTFLSASTIDIEQGIGAIDIDAAIGERRTIENGNKLVLLADSSKFDRPSCAKVGPVDLIDVLITDVGVSQKIVDEFKSRGIEVVVAGPNGDEND